MRRMFLFAMIFLLSFCSAQTMRFSHLDQKQGLSQNTPTSFLQDCDGFIWVGTQDGLNRYDGYTFTVFRRIANDTNSLSDNFILSLAEDAKGNIWIGTRNGLCDHVNCRDSVATIRSSGNISENCIMHEGFSQNMSFRNLPPNVAIVKQQFAYNFIRLCSSY